MQKFTSSIKITSFDPKISVSFIKKLMLLGGYIIPNGLKVIKKKNTILRSPHVFKKARDQIEIKHVSHFFKVKPRYNWFFFFSLFKKANNNPIGLDYRHCYEQTILYLPQKHNKSE